MEDNRRKLESEKVYSIINNQLEDANRLLLKKIIGE